jgi:hypothetical protein
MQSTKLITFFCLCIVHSAFSQTAGALPDDYVKNKPSSNLESQFSIVVNPTLLITGRKKFL